LSAPALTILVVDDEDIVRETCQSMLEMLGYVALTACDGREALELYTARRDAIDAVVLDLAMPVMNGAQTLEGLRALSATLPVLLTSGFYPPELTERLAGQDGVGFLKKPYALVDLDVAVRRVLHGR
jgi:two-component system, cell cycle sensor histidine kinase and response regulator CckA